MKQAALCDGFAFDPFPFQHDDAAAPEVDVGGCEIADALVVSAVVVMIDEGRDLPLEIARQEVVFEQDPVLERLVPALDLALGLRVKWCSADMAHAVGVDPLGEFGGDVGRTVVAEQLRLVQHPGTTAAGRLQRHSQRVGDILGLHCGAQLPGDDVAGEVVEHRRQIEPTPADDLQICEVGLPELVGRCRLVMEFVGGLDDDEGRAGDQVMGLEQAIDRGFRDEVALRVGEGDRQFPGRQLRLVQRQLDDLDRKSVV